MKLAPEVGLDRRGRLVFAGRAGPREGQQRIPGTAAHDTGIDRRVDRPARDLRGAHGCAGHEREADPVPSTPCRVYFRTAARDKQPIAAGALPFSELEELAALANTMLEAQQAADERGRRSDEQLRHAQKMESLGRLVGGVVHDFNNLLTAILGYSDLIEGFPRSTRNRDSLIEIRKAVFRANPHPAAPCLQPAAPAEEHRGHEHRRRGHGAYVLTHHRGVGRAEHPPRPGLGHVLIDSSQVEQVLINLVVNARDAIDGRGTISIETGATDREGQGRGDWAMVSVTDTGTCG